MTSRLNKASYGRFVGQIAAIALMLLCAATAQAQAIARIELPAASPRDVAASESDIIDVWASGLDVVGIGEKVYLEGLPTGDTNVTTYTWAITQRPSGSNAALNATMGQLVSFRPDKSGDFVISMTPTAEDGSDGSIVNQTIIVATYASVGLFDQEDTSKAIAPNCAAGFCHGDAAQPRLNVTSQWLDSRHANKLQAHLQGDYGAYYATYCISCHVVGYDTDPLAVNGGFDDAANDVGFDISTIPGLVSDAVNLGIDGFAQLPGAVQDMASIQCESCHGAGTLHPQRLGQDHPGVAGVDLSQKQCARCHDSVSGFQQGFYQWDNSSHPITTDAAGGRVETRTGCINCHTGEGFVDHYVNGIEAEVVDNPNPITCSACHDPHGSPYEHQLRVVGAFTMPSGQLAEDPGKGGICFRCHNSRSDDGDATAISSFRGAHHGTQADMLMGINGAGFGLDYSRSSAHIRVVDDSCVSCHMAEPTESGSGVINPPLVGGHTFALRDSLGTEDPADDVVNTVNACNECHDLTTVNRTARGDFDGDAVVEGVQDEVQGLLDLLKPGILATFPGTSEGDDKTIGTNADNFELLSNNQRRALYNYNFVVDDGSLGVHNTSYAVQMLQRAYYGVYNRGINEDFPDIALRGPVPQASAHDWVIYQ